MCIRCNRYTHDTVDSIGLIWNKKRLYHPRGNNKKSTTFIFSRFLIYTTLTRPMIAGMFDIHAPCVRSHATLHF